VSQNGYSKSATSTLSTTSTRTKITKMIACCNEMHDFTSHKTWKKGIKVATIAVVTAQDEHI